MGTPRNDTKAMKQIGITTTVPLEVLLAAGRQPVDLNNVLVADPDPGRLIAIAERAGFPLNCCAWIKGIYGVCLDAGIEDVLRAAAQERRPTLVEVRLGDSAGIHLMRAKGLARAAVHEVLGAGLASRLKRMLTPWRRTR